MPQYNFLTFFASICAKQGIDPSTKKQTCLQWMDNSPLGKLSIHELERLAQNVERLGVEMYKLPTIMQLQNLNDSLELDHPIKSNRKCDVCKNVRFIVVVDLETGEECAARCKCMFPYDKGTFVYAEDLIASGRYVSHEVYSNSQSLLPEEEERFKKFMQRLSKKDIFNRRKV